MPLAKVELTGVAEMMTRLRELPKRVRNKVQRKGVQKANAVLKRGLKADAPKGRTKNLSKSVSAKVKTYRKAGPVGIVGAAVPQGAHAYITEKGTTERFTAKGKSRGKIAGSQWAEKSIRKNAPAAAQAIEQEIARGIEEQVVALGGTL